MGWKLKVWFLRLWEFLLQWPYRLLQFIKWFFGVERPRGRYVFLRWMFGLFFKALDLTPIPFLVEVFLDIIKWNTRALMPQERVVIESVFQKKINCTLIGIDARSWFVRRKLARAFVGLHTINFDQEIPDAILIHECVHIRQYQRHGSIYIMEALYAQRWGGGYDYGGEAGLIAHWDEGLMAFNYEQQAEILEDYYRKGAEAGVVYKKYVAEI